MMLSKQNPQTLATLTFKKKGVRKFHKSPCAHPGIRWMISAISAISRWEQLFDVGSTESLGPRQKSASAIFFGLKLGGGNSNILYFHPYLGKIPILTNKFQLGWNQQLGNFCHTKNSEFRIFLMGNCSWIWLKNLE